MPNDKLKAENLIASFLGLGYLPKAPGTWGSLGALGLYYLLPGEIFELWNLWYYLPALLLFSLFAVFISSKAEKTLGHDAPSIVIDEVCGFFTAVAILPKTLMVGIYAFVLFRVFDIAKPFPVGISQKLPRGWGIVVDDLLAGIYALILMQIINAIYPKFFGI
ncbi:MAG: phosphatidylglycerophosphatase A [Candidatus Cloacimonadota bacterium]